MKLFVLFLLTLAVITACSSASSNPSAQTSPAASPAPKVVYTGGGVTKLKEFDGRRVRDIELWEAADMKARLTKLLGDNFTAFTEGWLIESPITVEGDILMAAGCGGQDCAGNQYVMFVDTAKDNINIQHFDKGKMKIYKEKEEIKLPERFAADLATMKANSGVN
jgi:hypothetical protein